MHFSKLTFALLAASAFSAFAAPVDEFDAPELALRDAIPDADVDAEPTLYDLPDDLEIDVEDDIEDGTLSARDLEKRATCASKIVSFAKKQKGVKYVWGGGNCNGKTKGGFDCSGLTLYAVCQATNKKKKLPHNAQQQYSKYKSFGGKRYTLSKAKPGDLIFWGSSSNGCGSIYHTAIYAGKNKSGKRQIWTAPKPGDKVKLSTIWGKPCNNVVRFC